MISSTMAVTQPPTSASRHRTSRFGTTTNSAAKPSPVKTSGMKEMATLTASGTSWTSPRDSRATKDVAHRLAPASTGPSVMMAQYTSARCGKGRWRETRQMSLKAWSMVMINSNEVTSRKAPPIAVRRDAWRANWFR
ncbi:hypothetical protein D3C72_1957910 [compost metagenome]